MTVVLFIALITLTGCGKKKTLTCTQSSSENGFTNELKEVYHFKKDRVESATKTFSVVAEGDFAQYIDDYKNSAQTTADDYNKTNGFKAKIESDNNKISVTVEMDPSKMDETNYKENNMGENYDSLKSILTDEGYTCK